MGDNGVTPPIALTIAGSDSGGGAGIQADLKAFSALGVFGCSVVTAVTAQNTRAVTAVAEISIDIVAAQIDAVLDDIGADAVKTGMLSSSEIIDVVVAKVRQHDIRRLVVDPVMVAKSGDHLLRPEAVDALRSRLLPLSTVLTPNLPEAEVLVGHPVTSLATMRDAARELVELGAGAVVVKGGHLDGDPIDIFFDGSEWLELPAERIRTTSTHGTGCTFASAIAAYLARGETLPSAVQRAKAYLTEALRHAFPLGHGHGPVHHFYAWWPVPGGASD